MRDSPEAEWVAQVEDLLGPTLRSVMYLDQETQEVLYLRDDVEPVLEERLEYAFQTLMLDVMGMDGDERKYEHGDLVCISRRFEHALELHFPVSGTEGVAIALDADALALLDDPVPHLKGIVEEAGGGSAG